MREWSRVVSRFPAACTSSGTWNASHSPYLSQTADVAGLVMRQRRNLPG